MAESVRRKLSCQMVIGYFKHPFLAGVGYEGFGVVGFLGLPGCFISYDQWIRLPGTGGRKTKTAPAGAVFRTAYRLKLAIANVHGHFKTKTHFGHLGLGPHVELLHFWLMIKRQLLLACMDCIIPIRGNAVVGGIMKVTS